MFVVITITLPIEYVNAITNLEKIGVVKSRSEAIREALHTFLPREINHINALKQFELITKRQKVWL